MHLRKTLLVLSLTGALAAPLSLPALAADFADLPESHWAYDTMMEAVGLGLLQGTGGGQIGPSATMTWAEFLSVYSRAFAREEHAAALARGLPWDQAGYAAAQEAGLLRAEDGLAVALSGPILRQDAAVLLYRALPQSVLDQGRESSFWGPEPADATTFTDWGSMDPLHQEAVRALADHNVVQGRADGAFGCADTIQRADGATLIVRVLEKADTAPALREEREKEVLVRFLDRETGQAILPDQRVESYLGEPTSYLDDGLDVGYYNYSYDAPVPSWVSSACDTYTLYYEAMTPEEREEEDFWDKVALGQADPADSWMLDVWLTRPEGNARKYHLLFGDRNKYRFADQAEAEAAMTTISIPVWKLSGDGSKVSSSLSLTIHAAIAQDVLEIFTEIYEDPEQFPIYSVGGYSWRGDSATGEHNCGTAIDINADQNFQVREGQALVGSCWEPGEDPYSIVPGGSVTRAFAEHGWSWGGTAWAESSDPTTGYHDYMHFSYMGG